MESEIGRVVPDYRIEYFSEDPFKNDQTMKNITQFFDEMEKLLLSSLSVPEGFISDLKTYTSFSYTSTFTAPTTQFEELKDSNEVSVPDRGNTISQLMLNRISKESQMEINDE